MTRLLLDTHVVLWLAAAPERLGDALDDVAAADERLLSAASAWEIATKAARGRLELPLAPSAWIAEATARLALSHLPISWQDAVATAELPPLHRDPFDRLLVAQAQRHGCVLVTADAEVARYDVELLVIGR